MTVIAQATLWVTDYYWDTLETALYVSYHSDNKLPQERYIPKNKLRRIMEEMGYEVDRRLDRLRASKQDVWVSLYAFFKEAKEDTIKEIVNRW